MEMHWPDGAVNFRTSVPANAAGTPIGALECLVFTNCALMQKYLPGLLAVALGAAEPEEAILDSAANLPDMSDQFPETKADDEVPPGADPRTDGAANHPASPDRFTASDN